MDPFIETTPPSITILNGVVFEVPPRPSPFHLGFEIKADITTADSEQGQHLMEIGLIHLPVVSATN
jgi:hypothetical protein